MEPTNKRKLQQEKSRQKHAEHQIITPNDRNTGRDSSKLFIFWTNEMASVEDIYTSEVLYDDITSQLNKIKQLLYDRKQYRSQLKTLLRLMLFIIFSSCEVT